VVMVPSLPGVRRARTPENGSSPQSYGYVYSRSSLRRSIFMSIDSTANKIVIRAIEKSILEQGEIGVQVSAFCGDREVINAVGGVADPASCKPVDSNTLFNIWSIAKAVTATALHLQAERGLVDYDAPIARYWPEFAAHGKAQITVRHVLMHRSGIPQMPEGVTPERMSDWDWMVAGIADLVPIEPPDCHSMYQAMTYGWTLGEIIRRTDPAHRDVNRFLQEEINGPLGISDLWLGVAPTHFERIATLIDEMPPHPDYGLAPMFPRAMPNAVRLGAEIFERDHIRAALIPSVGGIATASSVARLFGMLANGGAAKNVRLLSEPRVATFSIPRAGFDTPDPVMFGSVMPISIAGYWLGSDQWPMNALGNPRAFGHPGFGGTIAWADPDGRFSVAICHNRLSMPTASADPILLIAEAIRAALKPLVRRG
jgi:CubicO group peptidase (beta-lactamase class C family)